MITKSVFDASPIVIRDTASTSCPPQSCPSCPSDQECLQRTQTATECAVYYCGPKAPTSKTVPIGGIVGGVIGGVVLILACIGIWYYKFIYEKKPVLLDDSDDVMMSTIDPAESVYAISNNMESHIGDPNLAPFPEQTNEKVVVRPPNMKAKRINSYDSFTKPIKTKTAKEIAAMQRRERQRQIARQANKNLQGVFIDPANPRHSIATTVSTSNASNILPIAYIPGVTVRPTKDNTRSLYSYDSESVFSDLNTIENASIVGDVMRANNGSPAYIASSENPTTTAIKAQPKLINVDKIEEEQEDDDDNEDADDTDVSSDMDVATKAGSVTHKESSMNLVTTIDEDSEDSDVDSDIENITRATSLRKPKDHVVLEIPLDKESSIQTKDSKTFQLSQLSSLEEIPIGFDSIDKPRLENQSFVENGSFVLDVEMDESPTSKEKNPFSDS